MKLGVQKTPLCSSVVDIVKQIVNTLWKEAAFAAAFILENYASMGSYGGWISLVVGCIAELPN